MECLASLCFITQVYLTGAVGIQPHPVASQDYVASTVVYTNQLGRYLGEASLVIEFKNDLYIEAKHISGLNVAEQDDGLNAIMVGVKIKLHD